MGFRKTIAIVGCTEETGVEIAIKFSSIDYRLLLISNDIPKLIQLSNRLLEMNPKAEIDKIECVKDGCWEADIIVLAVSSNEEKKIAEMMKEVATQKIVVSILSQESENVDLRYLLPHSRLVSVCNILKPKEISITGNDEDANNEISTIFFKAGFLSFDNEQIESKYHN
ncbi:MAG: hypothetical protein M3Z26_12350 [Bacteroidota bacterium]|nr:hypothetical protein [Bacteroidota bacterium]